MKKILAFSVFILAFNSFTFAADQTELVTGALTARVDASMAPLKIYKYFINGTEVAFVNGLQESRRMVEAVQAVQNGGICAKLKLKEAASETKKTPTYELIDFKDLATCASK